MILFCLLKQVNESKHPSVVKYTASTVIKMDRKQKPEEVRQKHQSSHLLKRRSKKCSKTKSQASQEVRGGVICQMGRGLKGLDSNIFKTIHPSSQESQPLPPTLADETVPHNVVVFNLETTGLGKCSRIITE